MRFPPMLLICSGIFMKANLKDLHTAQRVLTTGYCHFGFCYQQIQ